MHWSGMQELDDIIKKCSTLFLASDVELSLLLLQSIIDNSDRKILYEYAVTSYLSFIADKLVSHALKCSEITSDDKYSLEFFNGDIKHYVCNEYHYDIKDDYNYSTDFDSGSRIIIHERMSVVLTIWFNSSYRLLFSLDIVRSYDKYRSDLNLHQCSYEIQDGDITTSVTGDTFVNNILLFLKHTQS
jgi:hypothetical protein